MEQEKLKRSTVDKEKVVENGSSSSKRKQPSISGDEDEILALATPSKKERPSPAGPSNTGSKEPTIGPSLSRKPVFKSKKDKTAEPSPPIMNEAPSRISIKGKEKEHEPIQIKLKKAPTPTQSTPINEKKCKDVLKALMKIPEAMIFARPVDPELDGCPT